MQHTEVGLVLCCISPNLADLIFLIVRDLSKTMDRPAHIHLEEMYRIIRYDWKQATMDSTFTQNKIHDLFKPSVTVILLETRKQEEVFMDTLCISLEYQLHGKAKV